MGNIIASKCGSCGFENEHLQKMSDAPIALCPACNSNTYTKLISAAGFQLKGSGWYATDFKNAAKPKAETNTETKTETKTEEKVAAKSETAAAPAASAGASPACATE